MWIISNFYENILLKNNLMNKAIVLEFDFLLNLKKIVFIKLGSCDN